MIRIAGDDDVASLPCGAFGEMLHASNKRASGVDNFRRARFQVGSAGYASNSRYYGGNSGYYGNNITGAGGGGAAFTSPSDAIGFGQRRLVPEEPSPAVLAPHRELDVEGLRRPRASLPASTLPRQDRCRDSS